MAETLGITVEFRGKTTDFEQAVKTINGDLKETKSNIGLINKELKFDPSNVDKLAKKLDYLKEKEKELDEMTKTLKQGLNNINPSDNAKEWAYYNKMLQNATAEHENIKHELSQMPTAQVQAIGDGFEKWGDRLSNVGDKIENLGKKLSVISAGVMGLIAGGIKYNAQLEQYTTAYTTLLGDMDEANRVISNIQMDASASPFSVDALIEANQFLISAGVEADEARATILALGDAISATGGGSNELSRMASNLQQIKNLGKASSVDIKQFANAGINIYGLLADSMGVTTEQAKEMEVTYDALVQALSQASSEGGKYYGAMANQSETLNGSIAVLKDEIASLLGELTAELMPVIKDVLSYILDLVRGLKDMSPEQKKIITDIGLVLAVLGPVVTTIGSIVSSIGSMSSAIGGLLKSDALVKFFGMASKSGGLLSGIISKLGAVFKFLTGPIGILIGLFGLFYATSDKVRDSANGVASAVGGVLVTAFKTIWDAIQLVIDIVKKVIEILGNLWDKFLESTVGQIFVDVLSTIMDVITEIIGWVEKLIGWLDKAINWFRDLIGASNDFNSATIKSQGKMSNAGFDVQMSRGLMSGGMMSNDITLYNTFNITNGNGIDEAVVNEWADVLTKRVNLNLGRMV